jgi:hypothetical protein
MHERAPDAFLMHFGLSDARRRREPTMQTWTYRFETIKVRHNEESTVRLAPGAGSASTSWTSRRAC